MFVISKLHYVGWLPSAVALRIETCVVCAVMLGITVNGSTNSENEMMIMCE